jgi:hypothetical protein
MRKYVKLFLVAWCLILMHSCADLDVVNENNPDISRVLAKASDLEGVVRGAFVQYYTGLYGGASGPGVHLDGLSDNMTTTNAFSRFWDFTNEPRIEISNTLTYSGLPVIQQSWRQMNAVISSANDVINAIENRGIDPGEKRAMLLASAYFIKGIAMGDIANLYDRGFALEPGQPISEANLIPYTEMLNEALVNLDKAIALADDNSFTLPADFWPGMAYTNTEFSKVINSFAARYTINNGRAPGEYSPAVYTKALNYANKGITQDLIIQTDGNVYFAYYPWLSGLYWYFRIDNRVIALMSDDPDYPSKYPVALAGTAIPETTSDDQRLTTDYRYSGIMSFFNVARGPALQSTYFYVRYEQLWLNTNGNGPAPLFLVAENDMIRAECNLRLSNKGTAINIVNAGTRVTRGNLPPLATDASVDLVADAIYYEFDVEFPRTGCGVQYYAMRRRGALQAGTPLQFPIPADELVTIQQSNYTFGGVGNIGKPGTADGSNSWTN